MTAGVIAPSDELRFVQTLREGSEQAFASLVRTYDASLVRFARTIVHDRELAEEVVQETWLGVIRGLDKFRGDSSLKTWIFRIMINTAKTRVSREQRSVPFSALGDDLGEESVDADRFLADGHWASAPTSWDAVPEERLLANETLLCVRDAICALPPMQQQVITLRDVAGWPAEEVCAVLDLSEGNQRVLLHRARSRVRAALESYLELA